MSLERQHGKIVFVCDDCGDALETGTDDFDEALAELRGERWRAQKQGNDWEHRCPDCQGNEFEPV